MVDSDKDWLYRYRRTEAVETADVITVRRDNKPSLCFTGETVVHVTDSCRAPNTPGCRTEMILYKTRSGKFVCSGIQHTACGSEQDTHNAVVCKDEADVIEFFGHGRLAQMVFDKAGIADVEMVD